MRSRPRLLLGLAALVLAVSGCRMQLDVNVAMEKDGSGVIEVVVGLDADAIRRIGGDLQKVMKVDDLRQAGWTIDGPALESDGYTRVRVRHTFDTPEEANKIFEQIAGAKGPFQDFHLSRERSPRQTDWDFAGRVDFSGGIEAFSDAGVAAQLDGKPLGQGVDDLEKQLGESVDRLIKIRVGVRLPGDVTSNATTKADNGAVWAVQFGDHPLDLRAHGEDQPILFLVAVWVAVIAVVLLVLYALVRLAMRVTDKSKNATGG